MAGPAQGPNDAYSIPQRCHFILHCVRWARRYARIGDSGFEVPSFVYLITATNQERQRLALLLTYCLCK